MIERALEKYGGELPGTVEIWTTEVLIRRVDFMKLRRQGFYKEMPHGNKSDPSIYEFINKNEKQEIDNICNYLKAGSVLAACGGTTPDIINPQNGSAGCPDMLTDRIGLWPGDLAYYVKQYYLKLDDEFIQTMMDNHWHVKDDIDIDLDNIEVI